MNSLDVRTKLVETLRLDLVGPDNGHAFATELLSERPSRWYLTGFLVPTEAAVAAKEDPTAQEELGFEGGDSAAADDGGQADGGAGARHSRLPSSLGLSALVPADAKHLEARIVWGNCKPEAGGENAITGKGKGLPWRRVPREVVVVFNVTADGAPKDFPLACSEGIVASSSSPRRPPCPPTIPSSPPVGAGARRCRCGGTLRERLVGINDYRRSVAR